MSSEDVSIHIRLVLADSRSSHAKLSGKGLARLSPPLSLFHWSSCPSIFDKETVQQRSTCIYAKFPWGRDGKRVC